ncbi:thymidylate synthase-like protein [Cenococcum geophilum]
MNQHEEYQMENTNQIELARGHTPYSRPRSLPRLSSEPSKSPTPVLPLLTTKRFVAESTSSKPLSEQGIKIWDNNGGRKFLDSVGLSHHANTDYTGQGVDQIADVIGKLKNKPYDRHYPDVSFNIAFYVLLTHMLAHVCNLTPGTFTHTIGDAHVYIYHVDALKVQLEREPRDPPGYDPHKTITMKMSV